ncbi:MAG: alpha/beta hydrolase [Anaerolineae bacterium]|nr:alpha/beta hydrolase [Anaerolineae bacterium]
MTDTSFTPDFHPARPPAQPLAYRTAGSGPRDILLLHGWISSSRMWADVMRGLAPHFRCFAPDLPGCGDSLLVDDIPPTLADYRRAVLDFCAAQDIRPYATIGHSLGALVTLSLALEAPESMQRMVLLAPPVSGRLRMRLDILLRGEPGAWIFRHSRPWWKGLAWLGIPTVFAPTIRNLDHKLEATRRKAEDASRAEWAGTVGGARAVVTTDYRARLGEVRQPTLIVVGERDLTVPPEDGILAAGRIPHARLVRMPDVAHQVSDEAPEEIDRLLADFLLETEEEPAHA